MLLGRAQLYVTDYLMSSTFQQFVSLFEDFFFGLLRYWLAAYPGSLSKKQVEIGTVLKASDKAAILLTVVDKELNELKYERLGSIIRTMSGTLSRNRPIPANPLRAGMAVVWVVGRIRLRTRLLEPPRHRGQSARRRQPGQPAGTTRIPSSCLTPIAYCTRRHSPLRQDRKFRRRT